MSEQNPNQSPTNQSPVTTPKNTGNPPGKTLLETSADPNKNPENETVDKEVDSESTSTPPTKMASFKTKLFSSVPPSMIPTNYWPKKSQESTSTEAQIETGGGKFNSTISNFVRDYTSVLPRGTSTVSDKTSSSEKSVDSSGAEYQTERKTLTAAFTIALKSLIAQHAGTGLPVENDNEYLERFCLVVEHVFKHGYRVKSKWSVKKREYWEFIDQLRTLSPNVSSLNIINNVCSMEGIKTDLGRVHAWIRMALMEQSLATHWFTLSEHPSLSDYYEPWAIMRNTELVSIIGLLPSLTTLEFNLCLKDDNLDKKSETLDLSVFFRDANVHMDNRPDSSTKPRMPTETDSPSASNDSSKNLESLQKTLSTVIDQKVYLEHQNRDLSDKLQVALTQLRKLSTIEQECQMLRESLSDFELKNRELEAELKQLKMNQSSSRHLPSTGHDADANLQMELDQAQQELSTVQTELLEARSHKERDLNILKATQERLVQAIKDKEELRRRVELLESSNLHEEAQSEQVLLLSAQLKQMKEERDRLLTENQVLSERTRLHTEPENT